MCGLYYTFLIIEPTFDAVCCDFVLYNWNFSMFLNIILLIRELFMISALVYFAGHGFEFGDKYMMPVDCPMDNFCRKDCFCNKELIQLGMKASPRLLVILLDMCLKNPR